MAYILRIYMYTCSPLMLVACWLYVLWSTYQVEIWYVNRKEEEAKEEKNV